MHRMNELEGARGLLAIWVVIVHLIPAVGFDAATFGILAPLFSDGIRVKIFSAMSGLVIFILLERTRDGYLEYIAKRFLRLYPAYILVFFASVLLVDIYIAALEGNPFGGRFNAIRLNVAKQSAANLPEHVTSHMTMLHALIPDSILPMAAHAFLGQAWNITYEWVFYLSAPMLFWIGCKNKRFAIGGALLYIGAHFLSRPYVTLPTAAQYVSWFMMGILSHYIWRRFRETGITQTFLWAGVSAIALYGLTKELGAAIWAIMFVSILGASRPGAKGNGICATLKSKPLLFLGKISYSIYLVHMVPLYLAMYILNQGEYSHFEYALYLITATMVGTVAISMLLYKYVEQPAIQFGKLVVDSGRLSKPLRGSVS